MHIPILIEPGIAGGFQARAGEPFGVTADGQTPQQAAEHLATLLQERLKAGAHLAVIELSNGTPVFRQTLLDFQALPDEDWFFQTMRETIAENRRREDETGR